MTGVERQLCSRLRRRQQGGFKFRRQVPLGPYVVDFACYAARLVVEVDGPGHDASVDRDAARDGWLEARGFRIMRFTADDVLSGPGDVAETILLACSVPLAPSAGSDGYSTGKLGRGFYGE
jgi:very-short-patch-repair endonuclease